MTRLPAQLSPYNDFRSFILKFLLVVWAQLLNSASYSNRLPNDRWNPEDTDQFYKARTASQPYVALVANHCTTLLHCVLTWQCCKAVLSAPAAVACLKQGKVLQCV